MSILDISGSRTAKVKTKLSPLSDEKLKIIAEGNANDSDALFQGFIGIRSKKVVFQTAAYQLLKEREYKNNHKK